MTSEDNNKNHTEHNKNKKAQPDQLKLTKSIGVTQSVGIKHAPGGCRRGTTLC